MPMNRFRRKALDSTEGHLGVCTTHGVTCAICSKIQDFEKPFGQAHWARKYARFSGWTYVKYWGWVCGGCARELPGEVSRDNAAKDRQPWRAKGRKQRNVHRTGEHASNLRRLQVEIKLK